MRILIPAYEPAERLLELIKKLQEKCSFPIVIVDDGSSDKYRHIFQTAAELGCTVLYHDINRGKGRALKTGFAFIREQGETEGVVCADCDGQHLPDDIIKVARRVQQNQGLIILGARHFTGKVPLRSRFGNTVTRSIFTLATGTRITDTQTGLRGYSADMLDWLAGIPGERFEYEMNMLLEARQAGYKFEEIEIDTVYLQQNSSSHFHPLKDSVKVYLPIIKFCTSSFLSAVVDFLLLMVLGTFTSSLLFAVVAARACSSLLNYSLNRNFVFSGNRDGMKWPLPKYFGLVILILGLNYMLLHLLHENMGVPLFYAKLLTESILFVFSYSIQKVFVFRARPARQNTVPLT